MKYWCRIILLLMLVYSVVGAQAPDTLWTRTYGGHEYDHGFSICETNDNGFVIAGLTYSYGSGSPTYNNTYIIKTNANGDTLWTRVYAFPYFDVGYSIIQSENGNYVLAGTVGPAQDHDIYLMKINTTGNTLWTKQYSTSGDERARCLKETNDGGYIIVGYHGGPAIAYNVYVVKTDMSGTIQWTKSIGGSDFDFGNSIDVTSDNNYIICGSTADNYGYDDFYLVKLDSSGDTVWTTTYGGTNSDCSNSVQQTQDGGYIIIGNTTSYGAGNTDIYIVKTNPVGEVIWSRTYGASDDETGTGIVQTDDGGYIASGVTFSYGAGGQDAYLVRLNSDGDSVWTRTYGGFAHDSFRAVVITHDGGYAVVGCKDAAPGDVYLVKIAPDTFGIHEYQTYSERQGCSYTSILTGPIPLPTDKPYKIFDITGRQIHTLNPVPGIYFIEVDGEIKQKVVKVK